MYKRPLFFPSAISLEFGICDHNEELSQIQKQVLKSMDDIYVLADSGKFEKKALLRIEDMKKEYHYITDSKLSDELKMLYNENGIHVFGGNKK